MANSMYGSTGMGTSQTSTGKPFKEKIPSGYQAGRIQQFTPEAMQLYQSLFSHLGPESYLGRLAGGDQSMFAEIEAPALRQFSELQGGIASRFSGMGGGAGITGRKSSGFQNTQNQAAANFAQQLQSQRQGLQRQAIQDLMGLSSDLLSQKPYETFLTKKQNPWADIAGKFASAIPGAIVGGLTGGLPGAAMGGLSGFFGGGGNNGYNALPGLEDQFRTGQAYTY